MLNIPFRKFSDLIASVSDQIHTYADAGMVDDSTLISVVARCNDVLGVRLNPCRSKIIQIQDGMANLPDDFYKVEAALLVTTSEVNSGIPTINLEREIRDPQVHNTPVFAHLNIENLWVPVVREGIGTGMYNPCTDDFWEIPNSPVKNMVRKITNVLPLKLSNGCRNYTTEYCPNYYWKAEYSIDFEEGVIKAPFQKGELYISYLAQMVDEETGELLVPFHPKIWPYYEYSVLAKIYEMIFLNSDAEVTEKLTYVKRQANLAYTDAIDAVMSAKGKQWTEYTKQRELQFRNKWIKQFYC